MQKLKCPGCPNIIEIDNENLTEEIFSTFTPSTSGIYSAPPASGINSYPKHPVVCTKCGRVFPASQGTVVATD